ncbi:MAG: YMGG-like glycine zipper-containing protein [Terricaulis sp.]
MRGQAFIAASVFALMAIAQPASAQQYRTYGDAYAAQTQDCQRTQNGRTVGGALLGAGAGAVIGSHAGAHGHRSDGGLLGAAVGAVLGGAIGNSTARNSAACSGQVTGSYDPYYGQANSRYAQDQYQGRPYPGDNDGYYQGDNDGYYNDDRRDCRMGQEVFRDPYGREYSQNVMMCRGEDGVWRPDR